MSPRDKRPPWRKTLTDGPATPAPTPGATTTTDPEPAPTKCPEDLDCEDPRPDVVTGG